MASDSVNLIAALGSEAVLATYIPHGGVEKQFKILVDRQPSQTQQSAGGAYAVNKLEVEVPIDATHGMTAIQVRKDKIRFKWNLSDSQETEFTVQKIIREDLGIVPSDGGMFRLEVQG